MDGEWDHDMWHMSYPRFTCNRRTDSQFRTKEDNEHHIKDTPLLALPIDMIDSFIVSDDLHLLYQGITKKCLQYWVNGQKGKTQVKLRATDIDLLSIRLENVNTWRPAEIQRQIRGVSKLGLWKATEFRVFTLYAAFVVLDGVVTDEVYEHFKLFSCAIIILSCKYHFKHINVADQLIQEYLEGCIQTYGIDTISSNYHNLCHTIEELSHFGTPLTSISSFPFENNMMQLKLLVRSGKEPLTQISRRIKELSFLNETQANIISAKRITLKSENKKREMQHERKFNKIIFENEFLLQNDWKNSWFLTKNHEIVSLNYVTLDCQNQMWLYGAPLKTIGDFFNIPFGSTLLLIFESVGDFNDQLLRARFSETKKYVLNDIKCKLFIIQKNNKFVFFPLLHTLDTDVNTFQLSTLST